MRGRRGGAVGEGQTGRADGMRGRRVEAVGEGPLDWGSRQGRMDLSRRIEAVGMSGGSREAWQSEGRGSPEWGKRTEGKKITRDHIAT